MNAKENAVSSILLVIDSLGSGGAQRQIVSLAIGFANRGFNVSLFNYNPKIDHFRREVESHQIEIHDLEKRFRFDPRPLLHLRRLIASRRFDAVLSFLNTPNTYTILATIGSKYSRVVVSERFIFSDVNVEVSTWLRYQLYRFADFITVNSFHQRDRIIRTFPWARNKLITIWNGVDLSKFTPQQKELAAEKTSIRLLAVATLVDWKNAYNLIKALALVRRMNIPIHIDWAGRLDNSDNSQSEYARCQKLLHDLELVDAWCWLGVCENMHKIYSKYDALIHPSFLEGLPNAICEALATGLPILASNVCDHPLLVKNGVNGWLFDPHDPQSIADAIINFYQLTKSARQEMGDASRKFAMEKLGMDYFIDKYVRLI